LLPERLIRSQRCERSERLPCLLPSDLSHLWLRKAVERLGLPETRKQILAFFDYSSLFLRSPSRIRFLSFLFLRETPRDSAIHNINSLPLATIPPPERLGFAPRETPEGSLSGSKTLPFRVSRLPRDSGSLASLASLPERSPWFLI